MYTLFDFLSDIGGLSGILFYLCALIIGIWNFRTFDNMMVSNLFRVKPATLDLESVRSMKTLGADGDEIKLSSIPHCKELLAIT